MARISSFLSILMLPALAYAGLSHAQSPGMPERSANYRLDSASLLDATYLIELKQGSQLLSLARGLGSGGFETAKGNHVDFRSWYSTRWMDASITWMTQVTPNVGILHGFSTGERGPKYMIAPALKLGVMMQAQTGRHAFLSFRATTMLGGEFRERPCLADYGDIGGVQVVNCRLAATPLPPAQTLDYLVEEKPPNRHQASLMFALLF